MKLRLTDALHARPAHLVVRLASQFSSSITIAVGARRADAKRIVEVLALGAKKHDDVEISADGDDAERALDALRALVVRSFDGDLVPETARAAAPGIAVGHAAVLDTLDADVADAAAASVDEELARAHDAIGRATADVEALVGSLPEDEAVLFAPEIEILRALEQPIAERVRAGASAEEAVAAETPGEAHDLVLDARARLFGALAGGRGRLARALASRLEEHVVLVASELTPSLVAVLPERIVAIVAASGGAAGPLSHAAILARGRGVPLAFVEPHVIAAIGDGEIVIVDATTTTARVWVSPSAALVRGARARAAESAARVAMESARAPTLAHLGVVLRVNVSSVKDAVPSGAQGVGLVRTELVFAAHGAAPSEREQAGAFAAIASKARGAPVTVRLFDAGGDKPLAWLAPPASSPDARGMALLRAHGDVLRTQLAAATQARKRGDVRVLLPLVSSADDVAFVRARAGAGMPIGAMIETTEGVDAAEAIARAADFICIGTNDLAAAALGLAREEAALAMTPAIARLVARVVDAARTQKRSVTVCGELAGDPVAARVLVGLGVDTLSVAPSRVLPVALALAAATVDDCRAAAKAALSEADA